MSRAMHYSPLLLVFTLFASTSVSTAEEVMALGVKVAHLKMGDYVVAGDVMLSSDDDLPTQYWYWRMTSEGDLVQHGAIDMSDDHDPMLGEVVGTPDGGFLMLARFGGELWKVDNSGSVTKLGRVMQGDGTVNFLVETTDGGYLAGGSIFVKVGSESMNTDGIIFKLDSQGNVAWQKTYDRGELEEIWGTVPSEDGGFVFAMSTGNPNKFGVGDVSGVLVRCDQDGKVVKETKIPGLQVMPRIDRTSEEIALLGLVVAEGDSEEEGSVGITLTGFSEELEQTWKKEIDSFETMLFIPELVATEDGRYILTGQPPWDIEGDNFKDIPDAGIRMTVIRSGGDEKLTKDLRLQKMKKRGRMSSAMVGLMNGLLAVGAHVISTTTLTSMETEQVDIVVQKIRLDDGEVVWENRAKLQWGGLDLD